MWCSSYFSLGDITITRRWLQWSHSWIYHCVICSEYLEVPDLWYILDRSSEGPKGRHWYLWYLQCLYQLSCLQKIGCIATWSQKNLDREFATSLFRRFMYLIIIPWSSNNTRWSNTWFTVCSVTQWIKFYDLSKQLSCYPTR